MTYILDMTNLVSDRHCNWYEGALKSFNVANGNRTGEVEIILRRLK